MIRSMTGYGEAEGATSTGLLRVELRTVNHRYLNVNARLPAALSRWEPELREWLRAFFPRGHVNCTLRLERNGSDPSFGGYRLDDARVSAYLSIFEELGRRYGVSGTPDLGLLMRFNDIVLREEVEPDEIDLDGDQIRAVVEEAARRTVEMREDEGARLHRDLEERLAAVEAALVDIQEMAPQRLISERRRLSEAVRELLDGVAADEQRIAQEIAILAERWDVNEELVRFRSHVELFRQLLEADAGEAVGKRLAFLVQEMHREANTIGSKANDAGIAHRVVAIKDEIERLREQVENVE